MYRLRNKQKYFTLHYCGKVKAEAASLGHKKTPTDSHRFIIFNPSFT